MNHTDKISTMVTGRPDRSPGQACTTLQTTLYDLMQTMQDEVGPGEEHLVVAAVVALLRSGRIRFREHQGHATTASVSEPFPISA